MPNASIMLREHDLFVSSHQFWVLFVGDQPVSELTGMATDVNTNDTKIFGSVNDLLKVWEYNIKKENEPNLEEYSIKGAGLYKPEQFFKIKLSGDFETIIKPRWECAIQAARKINEQTIQYNVAASNGRDAFLSAFNSFTSTNAVVSFSDHDVSVGNANSVARTLGEVMGFDPINISGRSVFGQEKNLLPKEIYPELYEYSDYFLRNSSIPRNLCCI